MCVLNWVTSFVSPLIVRRRERERKRKGGLDYTVRHIHNFFASFKKVGENRAAGPRRSLAALWETELRVQTAFHVKHT